MIVDGMGKACPLPVILTKKAIKENAGEENILVKVDNEIATQNLSKMANQMGIKVETKTVSHSEFEVIFFTEGNCQECSIIDNPLGVDNNNYVVVISSDQMGSGDPEFGRKLLENFIYSLSEQDILPKKVIFYNAGVRMVTEDEKSINDLRALETAGCEILSCGLCLDFYGLKEKLQIGSVTNMYRIVEIIRTHYAIKP